MNLLKKVGALSIPFCFLLAGLGMLLLSKFEKTTGNFFQQLESNSTDWNNAHLLLLASTILLLPASLSIRSFINNKRAEILADIMIVVIAICSILLAGQYAIDFIMPILLEAEGGATKVHNLMLKNPMINTLFYKLPNLVFLAIMVLSTALVLSKALSRWNSILLIINWFAVLLGNLVHPYFQRTAIILLAASYLPIVLQQFKQTKSMNKINDEKK